MRPAVPPRPLGSPGPPGRFARSQSGAATVEFALLATMLIGVGAALLDIAYASYVRMRLSNAVTAAALHAQVNGRSVTADTVAGFLDEVRSVALDAAAPFRSATVTVLYNGRPDNGAFSLFYCRPDASSPWTGVETAASCGGGVTAGKFMTISIVVSRPTLFVRPALFGAIAQTSDFAVVRVQ